MTKQRLTLKLLTRFTSTQQMWIEQVYVADGVLGPQTDSDVDLGADAEASKIVYVDDIDLNGQGRIDLDAD